MGNANKKQRGEVTPKHLRQNYLSQFSLSNFSTNLSARSVGSVGSQQSAYSVSRPWSRVSRRRWHHSTLSNPLESSKTAWPVPHIEAVFLPEFKLNGDVTEKDFEIIDTISKGAFGKVYKVRKKDTKEIYALKMLSKSQVIADRAVQQVKDEVHIQSMCGHHPFIVNCPFYWQNRKRLFIISDYVPGGELLTLCQEYGPLPEELVKIYVVEIALAVDFLHNAGVIYRDLKLENILLDEACHTQLIDFGLAKWLKYGSKTTTICGTLQYMAPELVSMEPYGHAADWWSLGVVMCCLLCGELPTSVGPQEEEKDAPGSRRPAGSLPEHCDMGGAARSLLQRLLDASPGSRLRSLSALQQAAFFKDFSFADVRAKKFSPKMFLESHFPGGPGASLSSDPHFEGFESDLRES